MKGGRDSWDTGTRGSLIRLQAQLSVVAKSCEPPSAASAWALDFRCLRGILGVVYGPTSLSLDLGPRRATRRNAVAAMVTFL